MNFSFTDWIITTVSQWLTKNDSLPRRTYLCDFNHIRKQVRPGDVLLIEGHNRVSTVIRHITQSPWTHAALYIGQLRNIEDVKLREMAKEDSEADPERQLIIESEINSGTIISPITNYQDYHVRILRPQGLTAEDAQKVIGFAISRLGRKYDVRHVLDLARFLLPWGFFPRRWRSSLFQHNALQPTKDICSSMIADAFESVEYPILPLVGKSYENQLELIVRNPNLYTPSDFDYSPYFDVIKYPFFALDKKGAYHNLPWAKNIVSDDEINLISLSPEIQKFFTSPAFAVVGASVNRSKFGNKVLRCYLQKNKKVYSINPHEKIIEGIKCLKQIANLPDNVKSISIVTPPPVTEEIVDQAIIKKIQNIWMQPGSESVFAIEKCKQNNINVIANGPCILQELRFHE